MFPYFHCPSQVALFDRIITQVCQSETCIFRFHILERLVNQKPHLYFFDSVIDHRSLVMTIRAVCRRAERTRYIVVIYPSHRIRNMVHVVEIIVTLFMRIESNEMLNTEVLDIT